MHKTEQLESLADFYKLWAQDNGYPREELLSADEMLLVHGGTLSTGQVGILTTFIELWGKIEDQPEHNYEQR